MADAAPNSVTWKTERGGRLRLEAARTAPPSGQDEAGEPFCIQGPNPRIGEKGMGRDVWRIRLDDRELAAVEKAASLKNRPPSTWAREVLVRSARQTVASAPTRKKGGVRNV